MSIESKADQRIGRIVALTLQAMKAEVLPGRTTAEIDRVAAHTLRRWDAKSAPKLRYGFPATACISVNDEVVHGIPGDRKLENGDLVTIDVTAELDGYIADAAVSLVAGDATALHERLIGCARRAFNASMKYARAGRPIRRLGHEIERQVRSEGFHVIRELNGHGVGREIHEPPNVPNYGASWANERFREGLVITIEPIISAGTNQYYELSDGWTTRTIDGSLAAHHEHTILITRSRPVILTTAA